MCIGCVATINILVRPSRACSIYTNEMLTTAFAQVTQEGCNLSCNLGFGLRLDGGRALSEAHLLLVQLGLELGKTREDVPLPERLIAPIAGDAVQGAGLRCPHVSKDMCHSHSLARKCLSKLPFCANMTPRHARRGRNKKNAGGLNHMITRKKTMIDDAG